MGVSLIQVLALATVANFCKATVCVKVLVHLKVSCVWMERHPRVIGAEHSGRIELLLREV